MKNILRLMITVWAFSVALVPFVLDAQSNDVHKLLPEKLVTKKFDDAGIQMELPAEVPSESSSKKSVLIMLHPASQNEQAEQGYCVKILIRRLSKADLESNSRIASDPLTDDFNKWYKTNHPSLEIRKDTKNWRLRKDVPILDGSSLFVDARITITASVDADLAEVKRIVDSVKPLQ
jgi:hypothetical protein